MSYSLPDIITRCSEEILIHELKSARSHMAHTMYDFFNASGVTIIGRDETFENYVELAAWPEKNSFAVMNIEECENKGDPLSWLFKQKTIQVMNDSNQNIMKLVKQRFFPILNYAGFMIIPGQHSSTTNPDLFFIISADESLLTDEHLVIAQKYANYCSSLNLMKASSDQERFKKNHLQKAVDSLSNEISKQKKIRNNYLSLNIIGNSKNIIKVREDIAKLAPMRLSVLVQGDTGTGKELVAQELHRYSENRDGPFIAVNVASLNQSLIESELFGHVKGAFTGAYGEKAGYFKRAENGTLFLDEIGDLPFELQAKLLRVLQEKKFIPVGSTSEITFNARIVSATHKNLQQMIMNDAFRKDLYYRLAESRIQIEPLSKRISDIEALAVSFVDEYNKSVGTRFNLDVASIQALCSLEYDGNVRQLRSLIFHVCRTSEQIGFIKSETIHTVYHDNNAFHEPEINPAVMAFAEGFQSACTSFERKLLLDAIRMNEGSRIRAAKQLKLPIRTFYNKLKKCGLEGIEDEKMA
ncbi:sigma 54-interacting transcriptional regulator [Bartonella sp. LJL80]